MHNLKARTISALRFPVVSRFLLEGREAWQAAHRLVQFDPRTQAECYTMKNREQAFADVAFSLEVPYRGETGSYAKKPLNDRIRAAIQTVDDLVHGREVNMEFADQIATGDYYQKDSEAFAAMFPTQINGMPTGLSEKAIRLYDTQLGFFKEVEQLLTTAFQLTETAEVLDLDMEQHTRETAYLVVLALLKRFVAPMAGERVFGMEGLVRYRLFLYAIERALSKLSQDEQVIFQDTILKIRLVICPTLFISEAFRNELYQLSEYDDIFRTEYLKWGSFASEKEMRSILEKLVPVENRNAKGVNVDGILVYSFDRFLERAALGALDSVRDITTRFGSKEVRRRYEDGEAYLLNTHHEPFFIPPSKTAANLFVDIAKFTKMLTSENRVSMKNFLEEDFYQPIFAEIDKLRITGKNTTYLKWLKITYTQGDAIMLRSDIESAFEAARAIQKVLAEYMAKLKKEAWRLSPGDDDEGIIEGHITRIGKLVAGTGVTFGPAPAIARVPEGIQRDPIEILIADEINLSQRISERDEDVEKIYRAELKEARKENPQLKYPFFVHIRSVREGVKVIDNQGEAVTQEALHEYLRYCVKVKHGENEIAPTFSKLVSALHPELLAKFVILEPQLRFVFGIHAPTKELSLFRPVGDFIPAGFSSAVQVFELVRKNGFYKAFMELEGIPYLTQLERTKKTRLLAHVEL